MTFRYSKKHATKKRTGLQMDPRQEDVLKLAAERATVADLEALRKRLAQELQGKPGAEQALHNVDLQISAHLDNIAKLEVRLITDKRETGRPVV